MQSVEPFMLPPPAPFPPASPPHPTPSSPPLERTNFSSLEEVSLPLISIQSQAPASKVPKGGIVSSLSAPPHTHPDFFLKGYFSMGRITSFKGHLLPPSGPPVMMMALRHVPSLPRRKSCSYLARWSDSRSAAINTRESLISSARQQGRQTSCVKGQRGHQETSPQGKSPVR